LDRHDEADQRPEVCQSVEEERHHAKEEEEERERVLVQIDRDFQWEDERRHHHEWEEGAPLCVEAVRVLEGFESNLSIAYAREQEGRVPAFACR
jgi:hypothetical protein